MPNQHGSQKPEKASIIDTRSTALSWSSATAVRRKSSIGSPIPRVEDERLLRGGGRYISDLIATSASLRIKLLRSTYGHARVLAIDTAAARAKPGVMAVLTASDLEGIRNLPCDWVAPGMKVVPQHPILARDRVRYVGEPIVAVAAESAHAAEEALATINVQYEQLPAVVNQEAAMEEGAPQLHEAVPRNVGFAYRRNTGDCSRAFADAEVIVRRRLSNNRVTAAPLEARAALSQFDALTGRLTHYSSSQLPHIHARSLSECLGFPLEKLRLVVPDIGGGFGSKLGFYAEDVICAILAIRTNQPCSWIEGRAESFMATTHGRDQIQYVEIAARSNGQMTGLRTRLIADIGAYALGMGPGVPAINTGLSVTGAYYIPNVETEVIGVFTNRTPTGPYRGAGHPEATFLIERMLDELARELGRDPAEIRKMNFVRPSAMPYRSGWTLDSGDYAASLDGALALVGYAELRQQQARLREEGRYLGIGIATFAESSGAAPSTAMAAVGFRRAGHESARVVVHADGRATVFSGAQSTGQGHATSLAQIAAGVLGIPINDIEVIEGDTQAVPFGTGTFNSRSMPVGGSAVYEAAQKILHKATTIAGYKLQRRASDLIYENGVFRTKSHPGPMGSVAHSSKKVGQRIFRVIFKRRSGFELPVMQRGLESLTFADIAREAHLAHDIPFGMEPGLDETHFFDPKEVCCAYGTHIAVVEIDIETGHVGLLHHVVVDDCGRIINPLLVEGQVHGGSAQGIGQALMERMVHAADGQLLVNGFDTYAMPHATDLPAFRTAHSEIPTDVNPLGAKGVGEGATIGATPAVVNAVLDALSPLGVKDVPLPMTPAHVWHAIREAGIEPTAGRSNGTETIWQSDTTPLKRKSEDPTNA